MTSLLLINLSSAFLLGAGYSFVELLGIFKSVKSLFCSLWGWLYFLVNGLLASVALFLTFRDNAMDTFLGYKILIAGTSSLALLRVIMVPVKHGNAENKVIPMLEILLNHIKTEYDRDRSKAELKVIKEIMKGIDPIKAADSLPLLCSNLLRTLSEEDGKKMNEEIQRILSLNNGKKEIKSINLGIILAKYTGTELLKTSIEGIKEYLAETEEKEELDSLIDKYS